MGGAQLHWGQRGPLYGADMKCPQCNGAGRVVSGPPLGSADGPQYATCPTCNGSGTVPDESVLSVRDAMVAFIKAANEEAIANPIGVPVIRMSQNPPRLYPRLEFGSRYGMDQRKVLVWTDAEHHSEMTAEEAVDLFLGEQT